MDNIIYITEFDAETVDLMLEFLYTGDFDLFREGKYTTLAGRVDTESWVLASPERESVDDPSNSTRGTTTAVIKETIETLLRHVRVNSIADYYDISSLKQAANAKIQSILNEIWFAQGFPEIISEAFNTTSDEALHEIITATTAKRINELIELPDFATLELMNDFTIALLDKIISSHRDEVKTLTKASDSYRSQFQLARKWIETLQKDVKTMELMHENENRRTQRTLQSFDGVRVALASNASCQNSLCNTAFNCHIERAECQHGTTHPMFTLRCSKCGCKHDEPGERGWKISV